MKTVTMQHEAAAFAGLAAGQKNLRPSSSATAHDAIMARRKPAL